MPELPDIIVYIEALQQRVVGQSLYGVRLAHPFLLRTAEPPLSLVKNKRVIGLRRLGKRIAIGLEGELWLVMHLMIAGRLHCQTGGRLLADRALSRLLKSDWPRTIDELERPGTTR